MNRPTPADVPEHGTLLVRCEAGNSRRVYTVRFTGDGRPYLWKHGWPRIVRVAWENWQPVDAPWLTLPAGAGGWVDGS